MYYSSIPFSIVPTEKMTFSSTTTTNKMERPRIAICYAGQARAATCRFASSASILPRKTSLESIHENLLEPLRSISAKSGYPQ